MLLLSPPSAPELVIETDAHEGPVYVESDHALYFTTSRPNVAIRRLDLSSGALTTVRADANNANGMTLGPDGRLIVCEQGSRTQPAAITAVDPRSGAREVLIDHWHGLPLNSPNDVLVSRDGSIWFTDPSYGHRQGFRPRPVLGDRVYRLDPRSGELWGVVNGLDKPNGLAFSPSESVLYVGDNGRAHRLFSYVVLGRFLDGPRAFAELAPAHPDGIKVDAHGRVYATTADGILVFAPDGRRLQHISLPGAVNLAIAEDRLYITADRAIWAVRLDTEGA
jgi:gluconolactonase